MRYDLAIIGSGGAAFAAAIAARGKGASVVMAERGTVGGTCVNTGCVPSKALLAAAEARHVALDHRFPGVASGAREVDFGSLLAGKDGLVEELRKGKYTDLAAGYGWDIVEGQARFIRGPGLEIIGPGGSRTNIEADQYLIATGSAPWAPPIDGLAESGYLTSTTAMELDQLPESLIVIGGNAIGLEQGQLFARLGTEVTVIEALDRLAPFEEPEISAAIEQVLTDEGIGVVTGSTVVKVRHDRDGYAVTLVRDEMAAELRAEQLLVATGRRPVTEGLNLLEVGVAVGDRGEIVVDGHLQTSNDRIWAAGDVTGSPQFVYVAAAQGTLVADNALGGTARTLNYAALPRVTFTSPAIASVGMTDTQVIDAGLACDCRTLSMENVPRALVNRDTRGLIKLVAEQDTGRLLGAHVLADGAGDVITAATYALQAQMTVGQVAATWHPYLTMAEGLKLAAQTYSRDVAKLSCCAG